MEAEFKKALTGDDLSIFNKWSTRIDAVGPKKAYSEFKADYQGIDPNTAHTYIHIFGMLLYIKFGIKGVSYCDATFAYGCYHSLVARAIEEQGTQIVPLLNQLCSKNLEKLNVAITGCQHGIGHGVLGYYGYTFDSLEQALTVCYKLPEKFETNACEAGTYMEYDFRTMLLSQASQRPFNPSDPYDPCNRLAPYLQSDCYFWNDQWLISSLSGQDINENLDSPMVSIDLGNKIPAIFQRLGRVCNKIPNMRNQLSCFTGAGYFVGGFVGWSIPEAIQACDEFSPYGYAAVHGCLSNFEG